MALNGRTMSSTLCELKLSFSCSRVLILGLFAFNLCSVDDSFRDHQSDPEALYQRIKSVIDTSPAWKPSAVSFKNLITGNERLGRDVISANIEQINEVGPIPAQMSVVKRIYEEGRGFQDLKKQLFLFINHDRLDENKIPFSVRVYRVLYYSFAPLMQEVRELIGGE